MSSSDIPLTNISTFPDWTLRSGPIPRPSRPDHSPPHCAPWYRPPAQSDVPRIRTTDATQTHQAA